MNMFPYIESDALDSILLANFWGITEDIVHCDVLNSVEMTYSITTELRLANYAYKYDIGIDESEYKKGNLRRMYYIDKKQMSEIIEYLKPLTDIVTEQYTQSCTTLYNLTDKHNYMSDNDVLTDNTSPMIDTLRKLLDLRHIFEYAQSAPDSVQVILNFDPN